MSKTLEEVGMLAGGLALAVFAWPLGAAIAFDMEISVAAAGALINTMIGVGLATALAGTVGLLTATPEEPSSLSPQGQLPVQSPNPFWRQVYGLFQFGGAITFVDGPIEDWVGTTANSPCENQYMHQVHTLTSHQIAGFVAVVIDGETFNFGTDLQMLTEENYWIEVSGGKMVNVGPPGSWGFLNPCNPWCGVIWFEFDCGSPGTGTKPPFLSLLQYATMPIGGETFMIGSPRWTYQCLQLGRAKVHVGLHYEPENNESQGGPNGAPHAYVLGSGRIPTIEFKILGRIITDYRIQTAWLDDNAYAQYSYVLATGPAGDVNIFVQTASAGTSGSSEPAFAATAIGSSVSDNGLSWLNCGDPGYPADVVMDLNAPTSVKLVGNVLMADAWEGGQAYGGSSSGAVLSCGISGGGGGYNVGQTVPIIQGSNETAFVQVTAINNPTVRAATAIRLVFVGKGYTSGTCATGGSGPGTGLEVNIVAGVGSVFQVIEAPIGYFQYAASNLTAGTNEPTWSTTRGGTTADNGGSWICLGRSPNATVLTDDDGTQNQGGFSNPALVIADYLSTPRDEFGLGAPLTSDSIETIVAAANICDEPAAIEVFSDSTTLYERSFACNGCFDASTAYGDVLKSLALSMAGYVVPPGDCWRIYAGSYIPPELTLGDADARAPIKADIRLAARDTCNGVKGQYIPAFLPVNPSGSLVNSPASAAWKKVDFPPVQRANYIEEDGGAILWKDIDLDFTVSLWMAQRIARIVLERLRRQVTVSLPAKSTPLSLLAGDTVTFNHPRWQGTNPPMPSVFFIPHITPRIEEGSDGAPALGVDLVLRETDADVYAFDPPTSPTDFGDYSPYGQTGVGAGNVE
jgi:hypothetical protein